MSPGANTPNTTSAERLDELFYRHKALMDEWKELMLTPSGHVRHTFSAVRQAAIDEIQSLTAGVENEINQIIKDS